MRQSGYKVDKKQLLSLAALQSFDYFADQHYRKENPRCLCFAPPRGSSAYAAIIYILTAASPHTLVKRKQDCEHVVSNSTLRSSKTKNLQYWEKITQENIYFDKGSLTHLIKDPIHCHGQHHSAGTVH